MHKTHFWFLWCKECNFWFLWCKKCNFWFLWCKTHLLLCSRSIPLLKLSTNFIRVLVCRLNSSFCCRIKLMEWVELTDDTVEYLPVRGVKNPIRLTGGEDKRSGKPIMIEHLEWNFWIKNYFKICRFNLSFWTDKGQVEPNWRGRLQI